MSGKPKVLVIVGTIRENRIGRNIAEWYLREVKIAAPDLDFELLDLRDLDLPVFNEAVPPMMHKYSDRQQKLAEKIKNADGFIFVTGEYNHSIPGSLKNFIDYLYTEWNHKAAAFVGYGSAGGVRSIEHLIQVMNELKVASIRDNILIFKAYSSVDENGIPKPEFVHGRVDTQMREFQWWTHALRDARNKAVSE